MKSKQRLQRRQNNLLDAELDHWLRLSLISGLGVRSQLLLLRTFGDPAAVFSASRAELHGLLSPTLIDKLIRAAQQGDYPERHLTAAWLEDINHAVLTLSDACYPPQLLSLPDPPTILYAKGNLNLLNTAALSIVGSRNSTPQGVRNAEAFAEHLSNRGFCIVSGLASGIDAAAHRGGLSGKGSSIAVIGTGIDRIYPASNRDLAHQLAKDGLILSEFPLGSPPIAAHFPQRNRIIAALSLGCLVVEAALESGSLITARQAVDIGREVFAIPGSIHSPVAKGCHALIKNGAKLVESADDIWAELCLQKDLFTHADPVDPLPTHEQLDSPILDALGWDPIDLETLIERTSLTNSALCEILLGLELEGKLASLPGGRYQRIGGGV